MTAMNGHEILESLRSLGVTVQAAGPDRLRLEPASKIPAEMIPGIREAKPAILEALRNRPATCSPDCYELEPDVWIHRPHTGCTTIRPEASGSQHKVAVTCWHCRGEKRCTCIACWQTGQCVTCKGTGQIWRWIQ
ncbi:MAG: hypothetical protein DMG58_20025 [Acidobacteria bacterium]|nr:MAG: hypothetical protein DMG58_20025 [Acidobacteriota bacterium]